MAKTIKKIVAFTLSFLLGAIAGMSLMQVKDVLNSTTLGVEQGYNEQLSFGNFFGEGITLTASAEEISSSSNSVRLTASITPAETTESKKVDWSMAWKNPSSAWASNKAVADYVRVTPTASGALTADVVCQEAFGEPVIITVTSQANPSASASCQVDYAQKVTSASLRFGNVQINLGGDTLIQYELSPSTTGPGGVVAADMQTSAVYTVAQNFEVSVTLKSVSDDELFRLKNGYPTGFHQTSQLNTYNWLGKSIYYDYEHDIKNWYIMTRSGDIKFNAMTVAEIMEQFDECQCATMYEVTLTLTGEHNTYTYTSTVYCSDYTYSVQPTVAVDYTRITF